VITMGVYQFMGLGRSVGAVAAPLSYLAARYQRDGLEDRAFFSGSGEMDQPPDMKRGGIQALVLFTTDEVYSQRVTSFDYLLNQPGRTSGKRCSGEVIPRLLRRRLKKNLGILTESSRDPAKPMRRESVEVYWCLYEQNRPTQTFERVVATLNVAKPIGRLGKEVWINLTGGTNIINSALQLAVSLLGVSARLYYTWTEHPDCIYHTVSNSDLGHPVQDRFWVDLPVLYFAFNDHHRRILQVLDELRNEELTLEQLYGFVVDGIQFEKPPVDSQRERYSWFQHVFLLPLRTQQLIAVTDETIMLGPGWRRLQRYYEAMPLPGESHLSLRQLAEQEAWLSREEWPTGR